ncbi:MAG: DUF2961 domain-containing protein [Thermomicrobiales bacterium]
MPLRPLHPCSSNRWRIQDPIRFQREQRITVQALSWRSPLGGQSRDLLLQDDIASTAFWYQAKPHALNR